MISVLLASTDRLVEAAFFVLLGIFFDFFDGLAARVLKAQSDLGVQLDSLADMVTSGVVPGIVMFQLFIRSIHKDWLDGLSCEIGNWTLFKETGDLALFGTKIHLLPFIGLLLTLGAAYRLAKFNIDERQTSSFIGLPTPAMALFVISLPLILRFSQYDFAIELIGNKYFLISVTLLLVILMNVELPLFSLKLKGVSLQKNIIELLFLIVSLLLLIFLQFVGIPIIIILYILLSLIKNSTNFKSL